MLENNRDPETEKYSQTLLKTQLVLEDLTNQSSSESILAFIMGQLADFHGYLTERQDIISGEFHTGELYGGGRREKLWRSFNEKRNTSTSTICEYNVEN